MCKLLDINLKFWHSHGKIKCELKNDTKLHNLLKENLSLKLNIFQLFKHLEF